MSKKRHTLIATEDFGTIAEDKKFQPRDRYGRFRQVEKQEGDEVSWPSGWDFANAPSPLNEFRGEEPSWMDQLRERLVRLILPQHLVIVESDPSQIDWKAFSKEIKALWAQRTTSTSPEPIQYLLKLFVEEDDQ